ncbi:hypothetical protein [Sulfurirhabdus autotrophica]|uniref:Uncharacterized protein n=1 Tax=Sulfurirhabdus autotrophica TaxID=1706046 RepID=A0A4R3XYY0_9PROT|nr:hypothetical protein [Sulfurirhabdus autotrophica]TCV84317.1 hypothetical protein EDC63_11282 [Sulfurirhabdus autotrophica]
MSRHDALPVYEVEYLPAERRVSDRCEPIQRLMELLPSSERRKSPGRREDDWNAYYAAGLPLSSL